jgi:hypothetical protein
MYKVWDRMQDLFGVDKMKLLGTDTDSFIVEIEHPDPYHALANLDNFMDNHDYKTAIDEDNNLIYECIFPDLYDKCIADGVKKKTPGLMTEEYKGKHIVTEFCGLAPKVYSMEYTSYKNIKDMETKEILPDKIKEKKVGKGIPKVCLKKRIQHEDYKNCLFEQKEKYGKARSIRSTNHYLNTVIINKKNLTPLDTKRYILPDGINTLAYGHKDISKYE